MFGISGFELFIIVGFALIIFGPDKLPQMARTAGRFINQFKRFQEDMENVIKAEMYGADRKQRIADTAKPGSGSSAKSGSGSSAKSDESAAESVADDYDDDEEEEEEE